MTLENTLFNGVAVTIIATIIGGLLKIMKDAGVKRAKQIGYEINIIDDNDHFKSKVAISFFSSYFICFLVIWIYFIHIDRIMSTHITFGAVQIILVIVSMALFIKIFPNKLFSSFSKQYQNKLLFIITLSLVIAFDLTLSEGSVEYYKDVIQVIDSTKIGYIFNNFSYLETSSFICMLLTMTILLRETTYEIYCISRYGVSNLLDGGGKASLYACYTCVFLLIVVPYLNIPFMILLNFLLTLI